MIRGADHILRALEKSTLSFSGYCMPKIGRNWDAGKALGVGRPMNNRALKHPYLAAVVS